MAHPWSIALRHDRQRAMVHEFLPEMGKRARSQDWSKAEWALTWLQLSIPEASP
jgi:hypothetical protein